jgi:phosphatidylserine/phosphatidylglycerophosphate/cardiolipin synthase-like enzyme
MLLVPGLTCWRAEQAHRVALFTDMEAYFLAAREAMSKARRSIHALNWAFDPDTLFEPDENGDGPPGDRFGPFLRDLAGENPELDIRILCWRSALAIAAAERFFPHRAKKCFAHSAVRFRLDGSTPLGACHHQKLIVVDDRLAFCGGGDIVPDRWDTSRHLDDDPRRQTSPRSGKDFESRHELMALVDGPAAAALGELFRRRWRRARLETPPEPSPQPPGEIEPDPWPSNAPVAARGATAGIARTAPKWRGEAEVRENESLHLAAIAAASGLIYMENQYFTSPVMAEALAGRLAERDGPEVVLVSTMHSPSWFDQLTMDQTRSRFLARLEAADAHGRFHAYCPLTRKGRFIVVHAKLSIIDDRLLRIGSANLNNRSMGFDTECDLVIEREEGEAGEEAGRTIAEFRTALVAHWLEVSPQAVAEQATRLGALAAAIETLDRGQRRRLQPLQAKRLGVVADLIARYHLGDPISAGDSWRPWARKRDIELALALARTKAAAARSAQVC